MDSILLHFSLIFFVSFYALAHQENEQNDYDFCQQYQEQLAYDVSGLKCPQPHIVAKNHFVPRGSNIDAICYFNCSRPSQVMFEWSTNGNKVVKADRTNTTDRHIHVSFQPESDGELSCTIHDKEIGVNSISVTLYDSNGYWSMNLDSNPQANGECVLRVTLYSRYMLSRF